MSNRAEKVYQGKALTLQLESAEFPNGVTDTLEIIRHPGGAATVALDAADRVCLIRQFRYAADQWLWEVPAGRLDGEEEPLMTAKRELAEEAGLEAQQWQSLGTIYPSPGICDERIHLYLARKFTMVEQNHEPLEFIEVHWLPFQEALRLANRGEISDAKTLVALYRAQAYFGMP